MATLLLGLVDELYNSSVWKVLPADVPDNIKRAFTLGSPRVLSLWPPQIDYLGNHNPFAENAKFQFLSTPTSGGKTLLAQILIAHHLSTRLTSACYIAPTRSLCREVTASMKDRLRYLNLKVKLRETIEDFDLDEDDIIEPTIDILTPESLAALVRKDAAAVFWKYGLFVFDEVHSVGDYGRGITIEQTISLLKTVSAENNTRIAMISAVIGNRSHFITWLSAGQNQVLESHSTWRGPRRINAIWNTNRSRTIEREEIIRGSVNVRRTYHKLFGQLTIRTSMTGNTTKVETIQPIGEIAMMYPKSNPRTMKRDPSKSLNHNGALVPLIELLAIRGPVLCIEATKLATVGLAKAIANSRADIDSDEVKELANFIEAKLSSAHPLSRVVKRGVAYHHGSLPNDIRTEIEKAVVDGTITALVATTTMTEGVNLPVQAVVISNVGSYQNNQEFLKFIKGPKMANAIGRAGRATKETEGCVVLFHKGQPSSETFKALDPDDEDKFISSNLTTAEFLAELSAYEASKLNNIDAILECKSAVLSGFFSFLWFYMYTVSPEGDPDETKINAYLENTMAWVQGSNEIKTSIVLLSNELKAKYVATDNNTRKIYAKSGSRLGTTKVLKEVYSTIMNDLSSNKSDIDILRTILNEATLPLILQVSEAPSKPIYNRRTVRTAISIPTIALLEDWINGMSYPDLSTKYLSAVADPDFRFEQLGEYITSYFDNFFPWVVGTIINWANESDEIEDAMPVHLPGLIRGGVPNEVALVALQQGIYSRQLAINISTWKATHAPEVSRYRIRVELQKNRISKLIENLNPSPSELRNLIEFLAEDKTQLLSELSGTGLCAITFWDNDNTSPGGCYIRGLGIRDNYELLRDQLVVGTIPTMYHVEIRTLLASGIPFACVISDDGAYLKLSVDGFETAG